MSAELQDTAVVEADVTNRRHAMAFRIAVAAAGGFTLGHLLGWDFPFLPSLIAVQLLSAGPTLDLRRAIGFVVLMAIGCGLSLFISLAFADKPLTLIVVVYLLIFLEFLAVARGKTAAGIFLITTAFVPLMAVSSIELAYGLVHDLVVGSILALLLVFFVHAVFPARDGPQQDTTREPQKEATLAVALANAGVVMSLFVYFMGAGTPTSIIVIMVTAITILQQPGIASRGAAFGLVIGNVAGGFAATVAYLLVSLLPSPAFLFLVVLLLGLVFGTRIAEGTKMGPVYTVAAATFLVVLGLGLSPLPQDSGTLFLSRVSTVIAASLYTIGVASVLRWLLVERSLRSIKWST
jgi:Protein of unknown function (DUF2955)